MPYRYIADTYAWIAYFNENKFQEIIDNNIIETPSIAVAEIIRTMIRKDIEKETIEKSIEFVYQKGPILDLGFREAVRGGKTIEREKLSFVDGVIYSYIENENDRLLSGDEHFRAKKRVIFQKE